MFPSSFKTTPLTVKFVDQKDLHDYICYAYDLLNFQIWGEVSFLYRKITISGMKDLNTDELAIIKNATKAGQIEAEWIELFFQDLRNKQFIPDGEYLIDLTW